MTDSIHWNGHSKGELAMQFIGRSKGELAMQFIGRSKAELDMESLGRSKGELDMGVSRTYTPRGHEGRHVQLERERDVGGDLPP